MKPERISKAREGVLDNRELLKVSETFHDELLRVSIRIHKVVRCTEMILSGETSAKVIAWELKLLKRLTADLLKLPGELKQVAGEIKKMQNGTDV